MLVSLGSDNSVRLWDTATGRELQCHHLGQGPFADWDGGGPRPNGAVFAPDGRTFAAAGHNRLGRVWDVATGKERCRLGREYQTDILSLLPRWENAGNRRLGLVQLVRPPVGPGRQGGAPPADVGAEQGRLKSCRVPGVLAGRQDVGRRRLRPSPQTREAGQGSAAADAAALRRGCGERDRGAEPLFGARRVAGLRRRRP